MDCAGHSADRPQRRLRPFAVRSEPWIQPISTQCSQRGAELGRVLVDKFDWEPAYAEEVVAQLVRIGELVEPSETIEDIDDDPDDNRVLEAAGEGHAELIVSGDRHLLALGSWRNIPITKPAGFPGDA